MNDHNILQCAIHMVHEWSLPPNTLHMCIDPKKDVLQDRLL